jgi:hypothetical protein
MPRCHPESTSSSSRRQSLLHMACAMPLALAALGALCGATALPARAQTLVPLTRVLPPDSLRGKLAIGTPPEAALNGQAARLAPGIRVRGTNNMLILTGALAGMEAVVNYRLEVTTGLIKDVWVLTDAEASQRWPSTLQEASTWVYDPVTQTWSKP